MTHRVGNVLAQLRYRYFPDHLIGEILTKRWIDNAIPFLVLVVAIVVFGILLPGFLTLTGLSDLGRQFAEFGLIVIGLTIVMISGGIDLSVASVYTLAVLLSLLCVNVEGWSVGLSFLAVLAALAKSASFSVVDLDLNLKLHPARYRRPSARQARNPIAWPWSPPARAAFRPGYAEAMTACCRTSHAPCR